MKCVYQQGAIWLLCLADAVIHRDLQFIQTHSACHSGAEMVWGFMLGAVYSYTADTVCFLTQVLSKGKPLDFFCGHNSNANIVKKVPLRESSALQSYLGWRCHPRPAHGPARPSPAVCAAGPAVCTTWGRWFGTSGWCSRWNAGFQGQCNPAWDPDALRTAPSPPL